MWAFGNGAETLHRPERQAIVNRHSVIASVLLSVLIGIALQPLAAHAQGPTHVMQWDSPGSGRGR